MIYKGYKGVIKWDNESNVFRGTVVNIQDVITFQGADFRNVVKAFIDSVEDYLEFCAKLGEEPKEPQKLLDTLLDEITPENVHGEQKC